jgi:hypothetical protein
LLKFCEKERLFCGKCNKLRLMTISVSWSSYFFSLYAWRQT